VKNSPQEPTKKMTIKDTPNKIQTQNEDAEKIEDSRFL
jgi:hypothetical protein